MDLASAGHVCVNYREKVRLGFHLLHILKGLIYTPKLQLFSSLSPPPFCLAGIALADDNDENLVTVLVHQLVDSPVRPPLLPPVDPPTQTAVPCRLEQRGIVAIQGDKFCQSCKHAGSDYLTGATRINGALVKIQCKINETVIEMTDTTFGNDYFFLEKVNVDTNDFNNCKAYPVLSPLAKCNIPTDLHGGITGGEVKLHKPPYGRKTFYALFKVE